MEKEEIPSELTCDYQGNEYSVGSTLPKISCIYLVCHNGVWEDKKIVRGYGC